MRRELPTQNRNLARGFDRRMVLVRAHKAVQHLRRRRLALLADLHVCTPQEAIQGLELRLGGRRLEPVGIRDEHGRAAHGSRRGERGGHVVFPQRDRVQQRRRGHLQRMPIGYDAHGFTQKRPPERKRASKTHVLQHPRGMLLHVGHDGGCARLECNPFRREAWGRKVEQVRVCSVVVRKVRPYTAREVVDVFVVESDRVCSLKVSISVAPVGGIGVCATTPTAIDVTSLAQEGGDYGCGQRGARAAHSHHDDLRSRAHARRRRGASGQRRRHSELNRFDARARA
mmetsp:Transcript_10886/g.35071  ORF Transcript_10886/g.35071 Transcript_10886/m.35071 type:complete len:285 (+) Transcript_10886:474-1328(+)